MNGNDLGYIFACPRCGSDMHSNSRYCNKCGYLNPNHPDNYNMGKYMNQTGMQEYSVNSNGTTNAQSVNTNIINSSAVNISFGSNAGNFNLCFLVNYIFYLSIVFIFFLMMIISSSGDIFQIMKSASWYYILAFTFYCIFQYSMQLIFMKMNCCWWHCLIPIYNIFVMSDALFHKKFLGFLIFVPVVGAFYLIILLYKLGKSFKSSGLFTVLFPFLMIPIIGFGSNAFNDICYVSGRDSLEQEYHKKKIYFTTSLVFIVFSIIALVYSNVVGISRGVGKFGSLYMYHNAEKIYEVTKEKVQKGAYSCDVNSNVLYFYYGDISDYVELPFYSLFFDPIEAYIKVIVTDGGVNGSKKYEYYISMSDGTSGFDETLYSDLTIDSIVEFPAVNVDVLEQNSCDLIRKA